MKKLSVLMASLMCLTVGGVYAAWTYSESSAVASISSDKGVQLASWVDSTEAPGVYTLTPVIKDNPVNNKDMFYFDSNLQVTGNTDNPHQVIFITNCDLVIKFQPSDYATDEVKTNGMATTVSFAMSKDITTFLFESEQIFTAFAATPITIEGVTTTREANKWTKQSDGSFTYTITKDALEDLLGLTVNPNLKLENSAEHDAFDDTIFGLTIKTTVAKKA